MRHGVIFTGLAFGLVLLLTLGCTSVRASTGTSAIGPTPNTSPTATFNTVPAGPLMIVGKNCGTLGGLRKVGNPAGQEQCLYDAYRHCQAATLMYIDAGVDAGKYHYLTTQPNGNGCAVADRVASYGLAPAQPQTYPCQGLLFLPITGAMGGLLAQQCGSEGDVRIPYAFA